MPKDPKLVAILLLGALSLLLFVNLRDAPIGRASEARCVSVVTGMVQSGDWLVPKLGDRVRLQKPPLFYWAGAATATLLGDGGPIAVRLPSALSALGLIVVVMLWARAWGSAGEALAAGAFLAVMLQVAASGRRGDAEMLLALLCVAALATFDRIFATRGRTLLPLLGALTGLAFLTKATAVLIVVVGPILVFLALRRELFRLRDPGALGAIAIALAIGLSWYAAVIAIVPGAVQELLNDLVLPLGAAPLADADAMHARPIGWYLGVLPSSAAPTILLLPVVVWRLISTRLYRDDPRRRFAALSFLVPLVAFSLLPQKQKHYTLAMLPGLALVTAESVTALAPHARAWLARSVGTILALGGIGGTAFCALFFVWIEPVAPILLIVGVLGLSTLFAIAGIAAVRGRGAPFACTWVVAFLLLMTVQRAVIEVRQEAIRASGIDPQSETGERLVRVAQEHPWYFRLLLPEDPRAEGSG
jgi:4-amino-4-deoxy-L-arabinose transferase-like glycosyltransferase